MLDTARYTSSRGMSLVELMVGLAVGMMVVLAALTMYTTTSIGARNTLDSAKLNIEIRGAMDLMVEDIRRAGYGGADFTDRGDTGGPYTDLVIRDYDGGTDNCILYAYDGDTDGELATTSAYEYYGFRIADNKVSMRNGGSQDLSSCANSPSAWQPLTDPNIVQIDQDNAFAIEYQCIAVEANTSATGWPEGLGEECKAGETAYEWALTVTPAALLETRQVTIDLGGALTRDSDMRMDLIQDVHVRNHRVVILP